MAIFAQNDQFQQQKMTDFVNGKSSIGRQHWSWEITNSRKEKKVVWSLRKSVLPHLR